MTEDAKERAQLEASLSSTGDRVVVVELCDIGDQMASMVRTIEVNGDMPGTVALGYALDAIARHAKAMTVQCGCENCQWVARVCDAEIAAFDAENGGAPVPIGRLN